MKIDLKKCFLFKNEKYQELISTVWIEMVSVILNICSLPDNLIKSFFDGIVFEFSVTVFRYNFLGKLY